MKTVLTILAALLLSVLAGCQAAGPKDRAIADKGFLLTVDFQQVQTLRYKFVVSRDIFINWGPAKSGSKAGKDVVHKFTETVEIVVAYTPVKVDPYGLTTIKATCETVKIKRTAPKGRRTEKRDAVTGFSGKTFTFAVSPTGKIEDYSELDELIRKVARKAFRPHGKMGQVKEPDMVDDFIATQWFLWDSISSIDNPLEGLSIGQTWKSVLSVPNPMVLRRARDVTYTLAEVRESEKGRLAVIRSSYSPAESVPHTWLNPYYGMGKFQMSGRFGFLRGYKIRELKGQGEELFNIDAGRIEQYNQNYQIQMDASYPMDLGVEPRITIKQNLKMQLLD